MTEVQQAPAPQPLKWQFHGRIVAVDNEVGGKTIVQSNGLIDIYSVLDESGLKDLLRDLRKKTKPRPADENF